MVEETEKYRIPLFDGTNFDNWKFRIETLLEELDLLKYVTEAYTEKVKFLESDTEAQRTTKQRELDAHLKKDRKCKSQIIQRIADSHLEYAKDKVTAFDLWTTLGNTFQRKGIASQLLTRKCLLSMKFDAKNDTLANHFLRFDKLIRNLRSSGGKLEEIDIVCHLLLTMPPEYDNVVIAIETLATDNLSIAFVKNRLLDEETKRHDTKKPSGGEIPSSTAFVSQPRSTSGPGQTQEISTTGRGFPYSCNYCKKRGHKWAECRKRDYDMKNKNSQSANAATESEDPDHSSNLCFSAVVGNHTSDEVKWFLDSGATEHLMNSSVKLSNTKKLEAPTRIRVAKAGSFLEANSTGDIHLTSLVNGKEKEITVKNVLSVQNLHYNLLSVRKLEMNGFKVTLENGQGIIMKKNEIVAIALRNETQLYELKFRKTVHANISIKSDDYQLWHKRTGHLNFEDIKRMQSQTSGMKINFSQETKKLCHICIEGKQACQPHNQERKRATRPLQLVHSDLIGPISPASQKYSKKYVLTFIDDFTHFTASYILDSKSEVLRFFKIFEAMASTHFNLKISRFRCDNGREYISKEIKNFFEGLGIQFEFTIRYTPQQNGVAERMNRTILEKARCMLLNCKLGKTFWPEAVQAAVYLINRSQTSSLKGKIPAAFWFRETIDVTKLKVFGCIAYLKIPKQILQGKFDSRSIKCLFVGYCPNGYKFWNPEDRKIVFGRDAVFDESRFSFDDLSNEQWISHEEDQHSSEEGEDFSTLEKTSEEHDKKGEKSQNEDDGDSEHECTQKTTEPKSDQQPRKSTRKKNLLRYLEDYAF